MSRLLLDTNLVNLLIPHPVVHPLWELYRADLYGHEHAISFQTYGELLEGAELANWGTRRRATQQQLLSGMLILHSDNQTVLAWAHLRAHAQRIGRRLQDGDAWIAATALRWGLLLVTHDRDFTGLNLPALRVLCRA